MMARLRTVLDTEIDGLLRSELRIVSEAEES